MSCLLPQFKCSPDTFALNTFKYHTHPSVSSSKSRDAISFRTQCILSTTSPPTLKATMTLLEFEKLQLSSLETIPNSVPADRSWQPSTSPAETAVLDLEKLPSFNTHPIPITANKPWTYVGSVGPPSKVYLGSILDKETLLTSEVVHACMVKIWNYQVDQSV